MFFSGVTAGLRWLIISKWIKREGFSPIHHFLNIFLLFAHLSWLRSWLFPSSPDVQWFFAQSHLPRQGCSTCCSKNPKFFGENCAKFLLRYSPISPREYLEWEGSNPSMCILRQMVKTSTTWQTQMRLRQQTSRADVSGGWLLKIWIS